MLNYYALITSCKSGFVFLKKIAVVTLMLLVFAESTEIMETLAQSVG